MGIYNRDNINYGSMLQNAIANRVAKAQREAQYLKDKGTLWGSTVKDVANTIGKGAFYSIEPQTLDEKKAELQRLEEAQAKYNEQVEQRRKFDSLFSSPSAAQVKANNEYFNYNPEPQLQSQAATNYMTGYRPNYGRNYVPAYELDEEAERYRNLNPYIEAMLQDYYGRG